MTDLVDGPAGCGTQYTREKKQKTLLQLHSKLRTEVSVSVKDGQREVVVVRKLKRPHTPITFSPSANIRRVACE